MAMAMELWLWQPLAMAGHNPPFNNILKTFKDRINILSILLRRKFA